MSRVSLYENSDPSTLGWKFETVFNELKDMSQVLLTVMCNSRFANTNDRQAVYFLVESIEKSTHSLKRICKILNSNFREWMGPWKHSFQKHAQSWPLHECCICYSYQPGIDFCENRHFICLECFLVLYWTASKDTRRATVACPQCRHKQSINEIFLRISRVEPLD